MTALEIFIAASSIAGGLGLLFALARIGRWLWGLFQRIDDFVDDLHGTPARPGVPERPGVMERLARLEDEVATVRHEVTTNDGSSLKDGMRRVEDKLDAHLESLED